MKEEGLCFYQQGEYEAAATLLMETEGLFRRGQREEAVDSLKEAANLLREAGEREKEAKTLELISRIRLEQRRWLEALHFYDLSLAAHPKGIKGTILRPLLKIPLSLLSRGVSV